MNTSHAGVVILHVAYVKYGQQPPSWAAHPSGDRNLSYTDGAYNFDSAKALAFMCRRDRPRDPINIVFQEIRAWGLASLGAAETEGQVPHQPGSENNFPRTTWYRNCLCESMR